MSGEPISESIKGLLKKIKTLAEKGFSGEREAAKSKLSALMDKYGITFDDLMDQECIDEKYHYRTRFEKKLLLLLAVMITDGRVKDYSRQRGGMIIKLRMTKAEHLEVAMLFNVYRKALKDELELFFSAFIQRHRIFPSSPTSDVRKSLTSEDIERIRRMVAMMQGIGNVGDPPRHD